MERGRTSPAVENVTSPDIVGLDLDIGDDNVISGEQTHLKSTFSLNEILEAMMHPLTG